MGSNSQKMLHVLYDKIVLWSNKFHKCLVKQRYIGSSYSLKLAKSREMANATGQSRNEHQEL